MNVNPNRVSRCIAIVVAGLLVPATASAQNRGTPADQEACTPDVFRLCSDFVPDEPAITACLQAKRAELSPACGKVFGPPVSTGHHRHQR